MAVQPSFRPDEASTFFRDGRADRPLVPGTVARGHLHTDWLLFTRKLAKSDDDWIQAATLVLSASNVTTLLTSGVNTNYRLLAGAGEADTMPFPLTHAVVEHGRNRFMIYCVVCHDTLGTGHGIIVQRGYTQPPSYHIERLRRVPVGHFFEVITNGYGSMPEYKHQIPPRDRWAIAAYIRALQLSQHYPVQDLSPEMKSAWQAFKAKTTGGER